MLCRLTALLLFWVLATSNSATNGAEPGAFPNRPVRLITGSSGGAADYVSRLVAQKLSERWGYQVVVDNRAAQAGVIGMGTAARSAPDGHTLAVGLTGTHAAPQFLYPSIPYDPVKDFIPVTTLSNSGIALVVHPSLPVKDARDFVAYARSRPGGVSYASAGTGTTSQLGAELFNQMTKAQLVHVPYKGAGLAFIGLLSGESPSGFVAASSATPHVAAGKLRALLVLSEKRSPSSPNIPSAPEAGFPGINASVWTGMFVPANTPKALVSRINRDVVDTLNLPETRQLLEKQGSEAIPSTPEAFTTFLAAEISKWGKVIKQAGLKAE
jgi:tripartite-type tricarboxylate transporter receptor subunit TctC